MMHMYQYTLLGGSVCTVYWKCLGRLILFWLIAKSKVVGKKFSKWIDLAVRVITISKIFMVAVWRITDYFPESPAKHFHYMVFHLSKFTVQITERLRIVA